MTTDRELDGLLLTTLLDAIPDAVLISDEKGIIIRVNQAAGRLFGYQPEDMTGEPVTLLMPPTMASYHDGIMQDYLETGQGRVIGRGRGVEGMRKDGSRFPLHLSLGHAEQDGRTHFVAIMHDISRRVAAEKAMERSARLDAIGQMTGGISHDFNNILTVIIGNLELLETRTEDETNRAMVSDALEAAELGAQLTAGLSAFSRIEASLGNPVDVNAAITAAIALITRTFDPHYEIAQDLDADLPPILADSTQLQSALINIALNARDAMPDGGKLVLRSETIAIDDAYIAQELDVAQGHYVRVSISDTGRGMDADTQARVFEPFFTTKPVGQGTGLGLAMVYGFVRQSGGHVTVYSEVGIGTTVALYFPVIAAERAAKQGKAAALAEKSTARKRVLVVEDNSQVRKLARARLEDLGYNVEEAVSGDLATNVLAEKASEIDIVFTDLVMPGEMDGLALARHVVASYPNIRILLTSGYAKDVLRHADDDFAQRILHKPYRQSELAAALAALFAAD